MQKNLSKKQGFSRVPVTYRLHGCNSLGPVELCVRVCMQMTHGLYQTFMDKFSSWFGKYFVVLAGHGSQTSSFLKQCKPNTQSKLYTHTQTLMHSDSAVCWLCEEIAAVAQFWPFTGKQDYAWTMNKEELLRKQLWSNRGTLFRDLHGTSRGNVRNGRYTYQHVQMYSRPVLVCSAAVIPSRTGIFELWTVATLHCKAVMVAVAAQETNWNCVATFPRNLYSTP
jgi:hypothetical protein